MNQRLIIPDDALNGDHALFSPSAAKRWKNCLASTGRSIGRENVSTAAAAEGTAAHWVLEHSLIFQLDPLFFSGALSPNGILITDSMCKHVQTALDWIYETAGDDEILVESRVDIYKALDPPVEEPLIYGTVDVRILGSDGILTIADYKHGKFPVPVKNNDQLVLYSLGALHEIDYSYDQVRLVIIQPRNGGIKETMITTEELLNKQFYYRMAIENALYKDAEATPSWETCKFCLAKHGCQEYANFRNRGVIDLFFA